MKLRFIILLLLIASLANAQTTIQIQKENGLYLVPCQVNGLSLRFVFDTGASDVSISLTEAIFMLKNGYLKESDLLGTTYYQLANGDISAGTQIILRKLSVGGIVLYNVKASVIHELDAQLLLGQSAIQRLGKYQFDYEKSAITFFNAPKSYASEGDNASYQTQGSASQHPYTGGYLEKRICSIGGGPLRTSPAINAPAIYYTKKGDVIYILEAACQGCSDSYYKVYINGYTGYLGIYFASKQ